MRSNVIVIFLVLCLGFLARAEPLWAACENSSQAMAMMVDSRLEDSLKRTLDTYKYLVCETQGIQVIQYSVDAHSSDGLNQQTQVAYEKHSHRLIGYFFVGDLPMSRQRPKSLPGSSFQWAEWLAGDLNPVETDRPLEQNELFSSRLNFRQNVQSYKHYFTKVAAYRLGNLRWDSTELQLIHDSDNESLILAKTLRRWVNRFQQGFGSYDYESDASDLNMKQLKVYEKLQDSVAVTVLVGHGSDGMSIAEKFMGLENILESPKALFNSKLLMIFSCDGAMDFEKPGRFVEQALLVGNNLNVVAPTANAYVDQETLSYAFFSQLSQGDLVGSAFKYFLQDQQPTGSLNWLAFQLFGDPLIR